MSKKIIMPKPVPARIVIDQQPDGSFVMKHNMKPIYAIGALSMMINITAGEISKTDALMIDPNRNSSPFKGSQEPESEPIPSTNETESNGKVS